MTRRDFVSFINDMIRRHDFMIDLALDHRTRWYLKAMRHTLIQALQQYQIEDFQCIPQAD